MKKKANILELEEIDIEDVSLSFQSEERRKVYHFLMLIFPEWVNLTDLAKDVLSDRGNVLGALKGDGKRYSKKLALMRVGLVECKKKTLGQYKIHFYRAKRKGPGILA